MEPSSLVDGWALTLCLCSYDARFSSGAQVVVTPGVLRFGHGVGCVCCGVAPLSTPLPRLSIPLPPCLVGVPLLREGWVSMMGAPLL